MADQKPQPIEPDPADAATPAPPDPPAQSGPDAVAEDAERAVEQAQQAVDAINAEAGAAGSLENLDLPDFSAPGGDQTNGAAGLALLRDVNLNVKVELGRTRMFVEDVLRLNEDSVIELDKLAGDPVDIYVNDRHVARGEVLVVNENFCVRVSEIMQSVGSED